MVHSNGADRPDPDAARAFHRYHHYDAAYLRLPTTVCNACIFAMPKQRHAARDDA